MSNVVTDTFAWLSDPQNWSGSAGIPVRLAEHLFYTGLVMVIAIAIAVPIGLFVGHTGRGRVAIVSRRRCAARPAHPRPAHACSSCSPASG